MSNSLSGTPSTPTRRDCRGNVIIYADPAIPSRMATHYNVGASISPSSPRIYAHASRSRSVNSLIPRSPSSVALFRDLDNDRNAPADIRSNVSQQSSNSPISHFTPTQSSHSSHASQSNSQNAPPLLFPGNAVSSPSGAIGLSALASALPSPGGPATPRRSLTASPHGSSTDPAFSSRSPYKLPENRSFNTYRAAISKELFGDATLDPPTRKLPRSPYKVLDAPDLREDFYLNLLDWGASNVLAVGLGPCVYLWMSSTAEVIKLTDVTKAVPVAGGPATTSRANLQDVSSIKWSESGAQLAVGLVSGHVQIWDVEAQRCVNELKPHAARVGVLAWRAHCLQSGSRDHHVWHRDTRSANASSQPDIRLVAHKQEVCGLRWSLDKSLLASGGNDNHLCIWRLEQPREPVLNLAAHSAAIKALDWSPHRYSLLASGGGSADRCIRIWNTLNGECLKAIDTGSQVCNLLWSRHTQELVSTHGYSQNDILVWNYPTMERLGRLTGHTTRVLYLACSPDGESIVTGAGDETLRFWRIFQKPEEFVCTPVMYMDKVTI